MNLHDVHETFISSLSSETLNLWILIDSGFNTKLHCIPDMTMNFSEFFQIMAEKYTIKVNSLTWSHYLIN